MEAGEACAVVESVKAASDVYAPLAGKVVETNQAVVDEPALVNGDAEGEGWFFRLELDDPAAFDALLDEDRLRRPSLRRTARDRTHCAELAALDAAGGFVARHIGPSEADDRGDAAQRSARRRLDDARRAGGAGGDPDRASALDLPPPVDEAGVLAELRGLAARNVPRSR